MQKNADFCLYDDDPRFSVNPRFYIY